MLPERELQTLRPVFEKQAAEWLLLFNPGVSLPEYYPL